MSAPEISVVIAACNRTAQLSACLDALAAQSLPTDSFEVVVVDDGGAAPAAPVVESFAARLNIRSMRQPNAGPAAARNSGARIANGRWLAFTDDDCLPDPLWLAALRRAFIEHPHALLGGCTFNALSDIPCSSASQLIQDFVYGYYNAVAHRARFFASNNLALPAADFAALGGFNPAFRTSEDRDLCDRWLGSSRPLISVPAAVVRHAHHLTLSSFWRQHLGYGRGARRFQLARRARASRSSVEPAFYLFILRQLPRALARHSMPLTMTFLLAVWQAANAAGWMLEMIKPEKPHASR